jgi:hypothetical protein
MLLPPGLGIIITAVVSGNGTFYKGGAERLYLHINKNERHGLPACDGTRVPITLVVSGVEYCGQLGSRSDYPYISVLTNLTDASGKNYKLTYVLLNSGLTKGKRAQLSVAGNRIVVM